MGTLSLTGMWADMGSYSDFQIHSASDSGANISHAVVVLPMSPLPWKRCIRGSGKAGCPLLIGRQGGRSLFLSPCLPCILLLHLVLFSPPNARMCQNTGAPTVPSCHVLNHLTTQHLQIKLHRQKTVHLLQLVGPAPMLQLN